MSEVMKECYRVMKPGAHGLVWAIPRTSHWTATAIENAGFEIRDVVTHLFGSGFPKSLDISKAIDKAAGVEREVLGVDPVRYSKLKNQLGGHVHPNGWEISSIKTHLITEPATESAKQYSGFGTALKPASEHWILIRKPCSEKTVAANVLKWGCGGINIDASRVVAKDQDVLDAAVKRMTGNKVTGWVYRGSACVKPNSAQGRFPANLVFSHSEFCTDEKCGELCAVKMLDAQSGTLETGGASRFFYCAKASKKDRNEGLPEGEVSSHPTVKSTKLMEYLITLITPPNGTILDPFMGSGSTGKAAVKLGFEFIGLEKEKEYFEIAKKRIDNAC
jgi:site-specific DNA-methyltransferase (adenine-specific)